MYKEKVHRVERKIKERIGSMPRYIYGKTNDVADHWGTETRKYTMAYIIDKNREVALGTISCCNEMDKPDKNMGKLYALKKMTGAISYIEGRENPNSKPVGGGKVPRFFYIAENHPDYPVQTPNLVINGRSSKEFDRFIASAVDMIQKELEKVFQD